MIPKKYVYTLLSQSRQWFGHPNVLTPKHKEVVAARNAANTATNPISSNPSQPNQAVDPNLDPSLVSRKGGPASKILPAVDTKTTSSGPNSATDSNAIPSTSSLSSNPYLSLSVFARQSPGSTTPIGHPVLPLHPYPMYYPPNTPITPNPLAYPTYSNPYYYLAGSIVPAPNGPYAPGAPFSPPLTQQPPIEPPRTAKRPKLHSVTRSFSIPMVPRDKKGMPMLPLNVGIMTVINLGEVCMREHFHTERYIFPVGYEVTRYMQSFAQFCHLLIVHISCF